MHALFDPEKGEPREVFAEWQKRWKSFLVIGILLIFFGTMGLFTTLFTSLITVLLLGAFTFSAGVLKMIGSFFALPSKQFFLQLLSGLLYVIVGAICIMKPVQALSAITLLIGFLFTINGIFKILAVFFTNVALSGWVFISGVLNVLLGLLILAEWPEASLWVVGLFVAIDLLLAGWTLVSLSLIAKEHS